MRMRFSVLITSALLFNGASLAGQTPAGAIALYPFDGTVDNTENRSLTGGIESGPTFVDGLHGQALRLGARDPATFFSLDAAGLPLGPNHDFSVQFWMRSETDADHRFVLLSQKEFVDNSLASQKNPGWVFYSSGGTWAWSMGSGDRRITYERDNGSRMPLNDGRWHQLTMTYSSARSEVRLFYDGVNWVSYKVMDSDGFDFGNAAPLVAGWDGREPGPAPEILPGIREGADQLQRLVDAFNGFGLPQVAPEELLLLIAEPRRLFNEKVDRVAAERGVDSLSFRQTMEEVDWDAVDDAERALMASPYTVHQNMNFTGIAPVSRLYDLVDGTVTIRREGTEHFADLERLSLPDFEMDELALWQRVLSPEEVLASYGSVENASPPALEEELTSLTAGDWNIWHGGKHFTPGEHGWDSRVAIAEMLKAQGADVVMMQETYSSGDFIAAELGYYFATTVDWDYLNQGSNISVLSRFPIKDVYVQEDSPFQNVGTRISISRSQDMYVMSNWYGMDQFPDVFDFHHERFLESDSIPVLFAGDFNAVPHTDGGDSPASVALLEAGFTDAFRSLYPDVQEHPGPTHRNGRRIDQLYYKGAGLRNTSTNVISTRAGGFPSDHYLIVSTFDLDYSTVRGGR